ncbi:hypothetical protein M1446_01015 [Candidatus Dependentiae bacterium]|nr:hypothetical protein [Candidatus Dependentiae bacterium]
MKKLFLLTCLSPFLLNGKNNYELVVRGDEPHIKITIGSGKHEDIYEFKAQWIDEHKFGQNEDCAYFKVPKELRSVIGTRSMIVCSSGRVFRNIGTVKGSSTGTPPHLMYKNYIGYNVESEGSMPGQGRRIVYCIGNCETKDEKITTKAPKMYKVKAPRMPREPKVTRVRRKLKY